MVKLNKFLCTLSFIFRIFQKIIIDKETFYFNSDKTRRRIIRRNHKVRDI